MMWKIAIFDDEPLIVAALSEKVDWAKISCKVVGTSYDGKTAISVIDKEKPDIVITDIVMPGLSGLELVSQYMAKKSNMRFILLSAHSDFMYAQKALQLGASDYILKPFEFEKLLQVVKRVIYDLDKNEMEKKRVTNLENEISRVNSIASASLLFDVARYGVDVLRDVQSAQNPYSVEPGIVIVATQYNVPQKENDHAIKTFDECYADYFAQKHLKLTKGKITNGLLFCCNMPKGISSEAGKGMILQAASAVNTSTSVLTGSICVTIVSERYTNFSELHEQYLFCQNELDKSFFINKSSVINITCTQKRHKNIESQFDISVDEMMKNISNGNLNDLNYCLSKLHEEYSTMCNRQQALEVLKELHMKATVIATRKGMIHLPQVPCEYNQGNFETHFLNIAQYLTEICNFLDANISISDKLLSMVDSNYEDANFGLASAADKLDMNPSYLSRLFKKATGVNFVDYLMKMRVEKAKHLLETTSLNNIDIAKQVGFENDSYFGQVFKKHCGVTPKQYRSCSNAIEL